MTTVKMPLSGDHRLRLVNVKEVKSVRDGSTNLKLEFKVMDTNDDDDMVIVVVSMMTAYPIIKIVKKLSKWHYQRLGKSISVLDLSKFIGKEGVFPLKIEEYNNKSFHTIDYRLI